MLAIGMTKWLCKRRGNGGRNRKTLICLENLSSCNAWNGQNIFTLQEVVGFMT